ncbi:MAG: hypothetical protein GXY50_05345 [Syntrophomonadaceae bacterium]|nr:hypothetical protein [Syntrophomonadaceae bacterium]
MNEQIIIEQRFCGPPESGNGGYSCGMLANFVGDSAEVKLISPPPLDTPLTVESREGRYTLLNGDTVVAAAEAAVVDIEVPAPPTLAQARETMAGAEIFEKHKFPTCFVCGPHRAECDGLRIFPGAVQGRNYVATEWIPDDSLTDDTGLVRNEIIWAALDCPGAWAVFAGRTRAIVLGKLAVQIMSRMKAHEPCIVLGWQIGEEGRKLMCGTALFSETGELYARARATWIELKKESQ